MKAPKTKGVGWDVFITDSDDGYLQIQRVDCPDVPVKEAHPRPEVQYGYGSRPVQERRPLLPAFGSDEEAILHVITRAKAGDKEAIAALWEVLDEDGLLNRILWCEAMGWNRPNDPAYPKGFMERWGYLYDEEV